MAHSLFSELMGQYIFESRVKQDILQKKLAKTLGISAQFLGRIEKGEVPIPRDILAKAAAVLDLSEAKMKRIYRQSFEEEFSELIDDVNRIADRDA